MPSSRRFARLPVFARCGLFALAAATALVFACGSDDDAPASGGGTNPPGDPTGDASGSSSGGGNGSSSGGTDPGKTTDGGGDGGTGDGAVSAPGACAGVREDFSAPQLDTTTTWRTVGFAGWTLEIVGGRLSFTPIASYKNTRNGVVTTRTAMNLTGCSISVEVARALPANVTGELNVSLLEPGVLMRITSGQLQLSMTVGGQAKTATIPYDPAAHRWERFREQGGVLYLETSPDAQTWTERLQGTPDGSLTAVNIALNVIDTSLGDDFEAPLFDNVNVVP